MKLFVRSVVVCAILCATVLVRAEADPAWLSWTVTDVCGNSVNLTNYQNKKVFVIVFTPGDAASCTIMRTAAAYCKEHPAVANKVLAFCSDDGGAKAVKLYLRQEEYTKRVAAWKAAHPEPDAQDEGAAAADIAMPDFVQQIEDEQATAEGLSAMCATHLPFKCCVRNDAMWTWLTCKMTAPAGAPRILKFNAQGNLLKERTTVPEPLDPDADD